ncbi:MAG TPA: efflux RND transporter periplasmic adaptor subunit, partial [Rhodocyclaceae bacterium]|nr:efflux RND transporter periplasmic adaptor subunit [Rhodocyclaceae bacterium]
MNRRIASIAITLGVVVLSACKNSPPPTVEEVRPVHSLTLRAGQSSLGARYSGEVRARYESRLSFQLSGRIVERKVELGSHVKRGQGLMQLDASTQRFGVDSAMAQLEAARHRVEQSRLDLSRHEALVKANFISRSVLDQKRLALEETQAQLSAAQSQLGVAREQLGYTELRADRDGVITTLEVERGQVVA